MAAVDVASLVELCSSPATSSPRGPTCSRGVSIKPWSTWRSASDAFVVALEGTPRHLRRDALITAYHTRSNAAVSALTLPGFTFAVDLCVLRVRLSRDGVTVTPACVQAQLPGGDQSLDVKGKLFIAPRTLPLCAGGHSSGAGTACESAAGENVDTLLQPFIVVGGVVCCPVDEHVSLCHGVVMLLNFSRRSSSPAANNHIFQVRRCGCFRTFFFLVVRRVFLTSSSKP
jgi:hypothetical protein